MKVENWDWLIRMKFLTISLVVLTTLVYAAPVIVLGFSKGFGNLHIVLYIVPAVANLLSWFYMIQTWRVEKLLKAQK